MRTPTLAEIPGLLYLETLRCGSCGFVGLDAAIEALHGQQLIMGALLNNAALVQHHDVVHAPNGG